MTHYAQRALKHIWFPCSQMKDYQRFPPVDVAYATGSCFFTPEGQDIIDAVSSWWCKSLGHQHPAIKAAIEQQLQTFEHIIAANTANQSLTVLSERLSELSPQLDKVFYAGDGSCAVEIALKMSIQARVIQGQQRPKFISLANGYHGETLVTLSVSDVGLYKAPYSQYCFDAMHLGPLPYVDGSQDPSQQIGEQLRAGMAWLADHTGVLTNLRQIGAVCTADLTVDLPRAGYELFQIGIKRGVWLRPLGNTLYWLPPLVIDDSTIGQLIEHSGKAIQALKTMSRA